MPCFKCGQMGHYANKCPNMRINTRQAGTRCWGGGAPHPYSVEYMAME